MPRISVIIVNYNGNNLIVDCLKAVGRQSFSDFEIIIVDNGSTDNSVDQIKNFLGNDPLTNPVRILPQSRNQGFAGGNIEGLAHAAEAEYVALLNNDAEPEKGWLKNLVAALDAHPDIGVCASKIIVFGTERIDSAGDGYSTALKGFKRGEGEEASLYEKQEFIFGACAGAALYRRKMLEEIGFLDEDFFLIQEDTDLNFRAQLAGWKILYVPSAIVYHKVRSTIGHMSDTAIYYTLRNSEYVRVKNLPLPLFLRCLPGFILGMMVEFFYFAVKHGKPGLYLRAKRDVLRNWRTLMNKRREVMSMKKVGNKYLYRMMTPVWERKFFSMKVRKFFRA